MKENRVESKIVRVINLVTLDNFRADSCDFALLSTETLSISSWWRTVSCDVFQNVRVWCGWSPTSKLAKVSTGSATCGGSCPSGIVMVPREDLKKGSLKQDKCHWDSKEKAEFWTVRRRGFRDGTVCRVSKAEVLTEKAKAHIVPIQSTHSPLPSSPTHTYDVHTRTHRTINNAHTEISTHAETSTHPEIRT